MNKIKKGEKVQLNSGGPIMTVASIGDYSLTGSGDVSALCVWFDGNKPIERVFDLETLAIYKDPIS